MSRTNSSVLQILLKSWRFLRRQPVLASVALWFFVVPAAFMSLLDRLLNPEDPLGSPALLDAMNAVDPHHVLFILLQVALLIVTVWGTACVLFVARRLVQNTSGRSRTSFKAVRTEALRLVLPLLLTSVLRLCIVIEWSMLFVLPALFFLIQTGCWEEIIAFAVDVMEGGNTAPSAHLSGCLWILLLLTPLLIPAIVYGIRTTFFQAAMAVEDARYRAALRRSRDVMRGQFWRAFGLVLGLVLAIGIPASFLKMFFSNTLGAISPKLLLTADILNSGVDALAGMLLLLTGVELFGVLRKRPMIRLHK